VNNSNITVNEAILENIEESKESPLNSSRKPPQKIDLGNLKTTKNRNAVEIGEATPGIPHNASKQLNPKNIIQKHSTTIKDLSPSKFSNFNRNSRGGRRVRKGDNSQTIKEIKKIIEKWPKIEENLEELNNSNKLNYKNIFQVRENLDEFKQEIKGSLKKRVDGIYNLTKDEVKNLDTKVCKMIDDLGAKDAIEEIKTINLKLEKLNVQFDSVHQQNKKTKRFYKKWKNSLILHLEISCMERKLSQMIQL